MCYAALSKKFSFVDPGRITGCQQIQLDYSSETSSQSVRGSNNHVGGKGSAGENSFCRLMLGLLNVMSEDSPN